jgi:hypothetical protein
LDSIQTLTILIEDSIELQKPFAYLFAFSFNKGLKLSYEPFLTDENLYSVLYLCLGNVIDVLLVIPFKERANLLSNLSVTSLWLILVH